jgi:hypothetical protein
MARVTIIEIAAVIVFIVAALGNPVAAEDKLRELPPRDEKRPAI